MQTSTSIHHPILHVVFHENTSKLSNMDHVTKSCLTVMCKAREIKSQCNFLKKIVQSVLCDVV